MPFARHRKTGHEFDFTDEEWPAYEKNDWEIIGEDGATASGTEQSPMARAASILADVASDPEKALAAYDAESAADDPDTDLLAALELIVGGNPDLVTPED